MSKIRLVLATRDTPMPANQTFGGSYLFKFNDAAQISSQPSVISDDLPDGDYVATCQSLDVNNASLNDTVSLNFTLAGGLIVVPGAPPAPAPGPVPDPSTYPAPSSLTATVVA